MSRLDELIKEYCPNGVKYKKINEISTLSRGKVISKKYIVENPGDYPVYSSQTENEGMLGSISTYDYCGRYLTWTTDGANAGTVFYRNGKFNITNVCGLVDVKDNNVNIKFLYYCLVREAPKHVNKGMGNPKLMSNVFGNIIVPVPPLPVQEEIVCILDTFTELTVELTTELTARKKQYEYYRNELLTFDDDVKTAKLGDVCSLQAGKSISATKIFNTLDVNHKIPCYGANGLRGYVSKSNEYGSKSLIGRQGALCGNVSYATGEYYATEHAVVVSDVDNIFNPRYLYHMLVHANLNQYKTAGAQPGLSVTRLNKVKITVPKRSIQDRIAHLLDNFDAICSDLKIGLPAEIEARQKQYEYYRDALLTFAETGDIIDQTDRQIDRQTDRQNIIRLIQYVFGYAPVRLDDIATVTRGGNFQKKDFSENGHQCIHYGQMYTHFGVYAEKCITHVSDDVFNKSKKAVPGDIVMAVTSENVEDVCSCTAWLGDETIAVSGHTAIIHHNQNAKYLSYYFHSSDFFRQKKKLAHGTKVIEVTPSALNDIIIPLPSIEKQNETVKVLDRFNSLCTDISSGIPAEIEARKKQYEYYRDKLLAFKEIEK